MRIKNIEHFFLEDSLYEEFDIDENDGEFIFSLIFYNGKIDCFCPSCEKESTFIGKNEPRFRGYSINSYSEMIGNGYDFNFLVNKIYPINFHCSRVEEHKMQQIVHLKCDRIFKIGQYPSLAEISQPELKKYRAVLSKDKYSELNKGVGLISHGVGIGAFVYLRRIFEDLIEESHQILNKIQGWDEEEYVKGRMNEKIEILKNELPNFLVENKSLYGILSKGIHELSEDDCKNYFPTVKLGIELILDEKLDAKKKNDKIELARKSLAAIKGELKK